MTKWKLVRYMVHTSFNCQTRIINRRNIEASFQTSKLCMYFEIGDKALFVEPHPDFTRLVSPIGRPHVAYRVDCRLHMQRGVRRDSVHGFEVNGLGVVDQLLQGHVFGPHKCLAEEGFQQVGCFPRLYLLPSDGTFFFGFLKVAITIGQRAMKRLINTHCGMRRNMPRAILNEV